jgi:hypothetical protein
LLPSAACSLALISANDAIVFLLNKLPMLCCLSNV